MRQFRTFAAPVLLGIAVLCTSCLEPSERPLPVLEKRGEATQLIVDGEPFLVLGGELHNSSSSSREYMAPYWPLLKASGMNTVLAAVEWSLVEPVEGEFDFAVVDDLLRDARSNDLRLILLWFGSWKNGQSHYVPGWVKRDFDRFPRVRAENGKSLEILSVFGEETLRCDARAFAAMMKHLAEKDSLYRTVIMVQVQNEVGILGSPRDHGEAANAAFREPVPGELISYLERNRETLLPELLKRWSSSGYSTSGSWEGVFGKGDHADEFFMAWHYARFINACAKAGKEEYPLPLFVNAWIVQPQDRRPGDYPSGGPQAHVLDLWRAGAPDVDLYCPDIYLPDFAEICSLYTRNGNPLFIPESRAGAQGAGQLFYAIGRHRAIGYSPFGIERILAGRDQEPVTDEPVAEAYTILKEFAPLVLEAQAEGRINSVLLVPEKQPSEKIVLGGYGILVELFRGWGAAPGVGERGGYCMIIHTAPDEYILYGRNVQVSFSPATPGPPVAAIEQLDEGRFENGEWIPGRRLNGDDIMLDYDLAGKALENKTGTGLKFRADNKLLQRVKLYRYE